MIQELEFKGKWWLPEDDKTVIDGLLTFNPKEGIRLELYGSFRNKNSINKGVKFETLLGISHEGKNITLYDGFETSSNFGVFGNQSSVLFAHVIFIGAHFINKKSIKFKNMNIHFSQLDEWCRISGFNIKHNHRNKSVTVKYTLPKPIIANISKTLQILINIKAQTPTLNIVQKEAKMSQKACLKIEAKNQKDFEYFMEIMFILQSFLCLAQNKTVYPLSINAQSESQFTMFKRKKYYEPI